MSTREGAYVVPATAASMERAARQLRQAFNDVFRYVPEPERCVPRRAVDKFCRAIIIGEQPAPIHYERENRECPQFAKPGVHVPDGDKYAYRDHTIRVTITGAYKYQDDARGIRRRVLDIRWRMESTYVYHAFVDGQDVAGTLDEVWAAQQSAKLTAGEVAEC